MCNDKRQMKICFALGLIILAVVLSGCVPAEVKQAEAARDQTLKQWREARTAKEAFEAFMVVIENQLQAALKDDAAPFRTSWLEGIHAERASSFKVAEENYRQTIASLSSHKESDADSQRKWRIPFLRAAIGHTLFRQGKTDEALKLFAEAEPDSFGFGPGYNEPAYKLVQGYFYKVYGQTLEQTGSIKRAIEMYDKGKKLGAHELNVIIERLQTTMLDAAVKHAREAEQQNRLREALERYRTALIISSELSAGQQFDFAVARETIELAMRLDPPPAIPESARKHAVRAKIFLERAEGREDYNLTLDEFEKALLIAPWWADAYYNYGLALEAADDPDGALQSFNLFLRAAPDDPAAREVQNKIYALEIDAEKLARYRRLEGTWQSPSIFKGQIDTVGINVRGRQLTIIHNPSNKVLYNLTIYPGQTPELKETKSCDYHSSTIDYFNKYCPEEQLAQRDCTNIGEISADGETIKVSAYSPRVGMRCNQDSWYLSKPVYTRVR